jgi:prolyl 4-hydroxylase
VCDWLIERSRGRLERARVYDVRTQSDFIDDSRTNSFAVFNIVETDLVQQMVQARMSVGCGQPMQHMEAATVLHYAVGETIGNHYDFVDPSQPGYAEEVARRGHRVVTFLVYLNEGYEGGETVFPRLGVSHSGRRGEGLLFVNTLPDGQPDLRTLHNGQPPTRGEKWLFSQFIRNRPEITLN